MNIILLVCDTFRYDNLLDRAVMPVRTPNLDRFAERSASFSRMYTSSFPTIPHRTDLTSGRYGWPWYWWQSRLKSTENHLPKMLGQAGYVSQLLCDCPHLFHNDFQEGFSAAHVLRGQESDPFFLRMNHEIENVVPSEKTLQYIGFQGHNMSDLHLWMNQRWFREEDRFAPRTAALAVEWLEENYKFDPFFLWVDFFDPHEPWDPPEYMVRRYDPDYSGPPMLYGNYGRASDYTEAELKNMRAHYCADAELADRWAGRVLQKIDDLQLWDNSVVVFTSDHGTCLGEHGRTGKANLHSGDDRDWPLYPEVAHIPFMIAAPGVEGGRTIDALIQPPDIAATLFDLAGVNIDPPEPLHGKSFAPMLRGESEKPIHDVAISGEFLRIEDGVAFQTESRPVVYTEKWAYAPVGSDGSPELYDLDSDPGAETNLAGEHPQVVRELHQKLIDWLREIDAPPEAITPYQ